MKRTRLARSLVPFVTLAALAPLARAQHTQPLCADLQTVEFPPDPAVFDNLGQGLAIDGDTALLGHQRDGTNGFDSGSVLVYERTADVWNLDQVLLPDDGTFQDRFGFSVAIEGDRAVIGAPQDGFRPGVVYVFERTGGAWFQAAKLEIDGDANDAFGSSVAFVGDTIVVGTPGDDDANPTNPFTSSGAAYVFERIAGKWVEIVKLLAFDTEPFDRFGVSVGMDGDRLVVGATGTDGAAFGNGGVYSYVRDLAGVWTHEQKLISPDTTTFDLGQSVAIEGDTVVAGAPFENAPEPGTGAAHVFVRVGGTWLRQAVLQGPLPDVSDNMGWSVAIDGDLVVVGALADDGAAGNPTFLNFGAVHLFHRDGGAWTPQPVITAFDGEQNDQFGRGLAIDGGQLLVGSPFSDGAGDENGAVYFYDVVSPFVPYDTGLAGSGGFVPAIGGQGCPSFGADSAVVVADGLGGAPGVLFIGGTSLHLPLLGGALLVGPPYYVTIAHVLDGPAGVAGAGTFVQPSLINSPGLAGLTVYLQALYADPGAPFGVSMTAGLAETVLD